MQNSYSTKAEPVSQSDRIRSIDVLRGVAVLGILMMNVWGFALPQNFPDSFRQNLHSLNFWAYAVITVLFEGKMRPCFQ